MQHQSHGSPILHVLLHFEKYWYNAKSTDFGMIQHSVLIPPLPLPSSVISGKLLDPLSSTTQQGALCAGNASFPVGLHGRCWEYKCDMHPVFIRFTFQLGNPTHKSMYMPHSVTHKHYFELFFSLGFRSWSFYRELKFGHNMLHLSVDIVVRTGTLSSELVYNCGSHFYFFRIHYLDYFPKHSRQVRSVKNATLDNQGIQWNRNYLKSAERENSTRQLS